MSNNPVIPEAAVEAALREWAIRGGLSPEGIVRNILTAADPHLEQAITDRLLAAGWQEPEKPYIDNRSDK